MSALEQTFETLLRLAPEVPDAQREYLFALPRRWRFDFAWPEQKVAVELPGGKWMRGRHQRPIGFQRDLEKANAAVLAGWRVLSYTGDDLSKRPVQVLAEVFSAIEGASG